MRLTYIGGLLAVVHASLTLAAEEHKPRRPCTIKSPSSGLEFDLNGLAVVPKEDDKKSEDKPVEGWMAKGYDYGVNFTMNFCAPVAEKLQKVRGVDEKLWRNVSAYYKQDGRIYSIGYALFLQS